MMAPRRDTRGKLSWEGKENGSRCRYPNPSSTSALAYALCLCPFLHSVAEDMGADVTEWEGELAGGAGLEVCVELLKQYCEDQILAEATDLTLR